MPQKQSSLCPLCASGNTALFYQDKWREYLRCATCYLVFVPFEYHLSLVDEMAEYDLHQNSPDDFGYRRFLSRIFEPVNSQMLPASSGLDFGSGPGPTLSVMFEEAGHCMAIYDPFFAPDDAPLQVQYDFVTASEVVEHFRRPMADFERLRACVKPGGLLAIMTKLVLGEDAFAQWHYKNDRTHVSFYSCETLQWLAAEWGAELTIVGNDVALFVW